MNATSLIDRLDDWVNPIVVKELRQAVKSRVVIVLLLVFLALQLFIVGMSLLYRHAQSAGEADWNAGREVFIWIQGVLAFTLILLVPAYACVRLAAERSDQNVDLLFISTLRPSSIVAGKFFAAFMLGVLIFGCCAPFMTFTYLLRGLDMPAIVFILVIDLLALLYATMTAMLLASIPGGMVAKVLAIFLGYVFHLVPLAIYTIAGTAVLVTVDPPSWDSQQFWSVTGASVGGTLAAVGLLFTYCTALISPPSSNRMLLIRAYVLAIWGLSLLALFVGEEYALAAAGAWMGVLVGWAVGMAVVLGLQFTISISERDQYGPRMQRQIPRNVLLRGPAFFLFGGAANGVLFTTALCLATMAIGARALDRASAALHGAPGHGGAETSVTFLAALVVLLYLYNYGLTAVLVRVYLLGDLMRSGFTWLLQMLFIGLGSAIPPLIAFTFLPTEMSQGNEAMWWKLPSPFLAVFNLSGEFLTGPVNDDFLTACLWFLGIWCVLVTLLSLPWMLRQGLAFHPRPRPQAEVAAKPAAAEAPAPAAEGEAAELPPATGVHAG